MMMLHDRTGHQYSQARRSFTLTELLVVVAMLAVLSALTVISVRGIGRSVRLSSATNAVTAALDTGRAIAMRDNKLVLVAFRAKQIGENRQVIEVITAEFTESSYNAPFVGLVDRFVPIQNIAVRELPEGIKVAGPGYGGSGSGGSDDDIWEANSHLPAMPNEAAGPIIGVMFGADGTTLTDNPRTDSNRVFIDFNRDRLQRQGGTDFDNINTFPEQFNYCSLAAGSQFFCQARTDDEPYITFVPFLAVFDDDQAREEYDTSLWMPLTTTRSADITEFVTDNANRIHFNRYTGVVMK